MGVVAVGHVRERSHRAGSLALGRVVSPRPHAVGAGSTSPVRSLQPSGWAPRVRPRRGRERRLDQHRHRDSLLAGVLLLAAFVHNERRADEPILPLGLLANPGRSTANVARGLVYAGMYGMFCFLSQFLQDVQGYSPLRTGIGFLPIPVSVFLASQLTGRVLVPRLPPKVLMLTGISLTTLSLLLSSRLHAGASYGQVVVDLVLLGAGTGISLVSLTSASLAGVEPRHAGAASGLVNVTQQIGAAIGLAVLVTVFGDVTNHAQLGAQVASAVGGGAQTTLVHGLDDVFRLAAVFAVMALVLVAVMVRPERGSVPAARPVLVSVAERRSSGATRTVDLALRDDGSPALAMSEATPVSSCSSRLT